MKDETNYVCLQTTGNVQRMLFYCIAFPINADIDTDTDSS